MKISKEVSNQLVDPTFYSNPDLLNSTFANLRKESPFAKAHPDGFEPFWVASKRADVMDIEKRTDTFHAGDKATNLVPEVMVKATLEATGGKANLLPALVAVDGEEHRALRAVTFKELAPKGIKGLESDIRKTAQTFVEHMQSMAPNCDYASDIAYYYPLRVIMKVLGVPEEDEPYLLELSQQMFGQRDPDLNRSGVELTPDKIMGYMSAIVADFDKYYKPVTKAYREKPQECLNSVIANAKINGEYLTEDQLLAYYIVTASAGHDTTSNTMSAAMWELAKDPALFDRLKANPDDIPLFVEESVRYASAVKNFMRSATEDTTVGGQQVKKGDWIMLSFHSAARDEDTYENPDEFNIDRPKGQQIAFGSGPHVCIGQHLARMEMRVFWEELIPKLKSIKLAGEPKLYLSNFVIGPKTMPVEFEVE